MHDHSAAGSPATRSTPSWLVPHFEKMLYDNAQLMHALPRRLLLARRLPARRRRPDVAYVGPRHDPSPDGGFYSAEDADSEGQEGKFYCWTRAELKELLEPDEFAMVTRTLASPNAGTSRTTATRSPCPIRTSSSIADPEPDRRGSGPARRGPGEDAGRPLANGSGRTSTTRCSPHGTA
jgi:uncharacterized protein YyaL (SSP411 family)